MSKEKTFKNKLLEYVYTISKQPILLKDLLVANRQHNDGMHVDPAKLGFRIRLVRAYQVYIGIVLAIIVPISLLTHKPLVKLTHIFLFWVLWLLLLLFLLDSIFLEIK